MTPGRYPSPVAVKQRWLEEWGMSPEWIREAERTGRIVIVEHLPTEAIT